MGIQPIAASSQFVDEVLNALSVQLEQGLTTAEVKQRQQKYGFNRLQQVQRRSRWQIFVAQFKSPIIALLAVAAVLSFAFQEWIEGVAVVIAISLNAMIGFITEVRAVRSMEALQQLSRTHTTVRRQGSIEQISAEALVPGDIVLFEGGDLVPADLRLIEGSKLQADESALTGESVPVSKTVKRLEPDLPLAEQKNLLFKGTSITRGSGVG
ncbi:MAG: cation-transporting P-type ATPase, partial [Thermosynechococcaceae cyanobacterium]